MSIKEQLAGLVEKWWEEAEQHRDLLAKAILRNKASELEAILAQQSAAVDGEVDCRCIDCGGDQTGHDPTCSYMYELHGEQPAAVDGAARRRDVRLWMRHNAGSYSTATELAEAADEVFRLPDGGLDNETHWVWDEAAEAAE